MVAFYHNTIHTLKVFDNSNTQNPTKICFVNFIVPLLNEYKLNFLYSAILPSKDNFDCRFNILWVSDLSIKSRFKRFLIFSMVLPYYELFINL